MSRRWVNKGYVSVIGIMALVFVVSLLAGCYVQPGQSKYATRPQPAQKKGPTPLYHDFGDVLIPGEMQVDKRSSFIYRTPGFSAGVLSLNGRVEMNSLIVFFDNNMPKDGWIPVSSFRSPRTIMLFNKENRWCVIGIREREFQTVAEIWVSPTMNQAINPMEEGLLK